MKNQELRTAYLFIVACVVLAVFTIGVNADSDYDPYAHHCHKHGKYCPTVTWTPTKRSTPTKTLMPTATRGIRLTSPATLCLPTSNHHCIETTNKNP